MKEKMRSGFLLLAILAAFFMLSVSYRYVHEQWIIDDCLSGKHGSFDYSAMSCDLKENHIYVPYSIRHPHDGSIARIAFMSLALFLSGYGLMKIGGKKA